MKKILAAAALAALAALPVQALEATVAPKVTQLGVSQPKSGLIVGNSYTFYNCGVHGYLRGLARAAGAKWRARMVTISSGRLAWHDVAQYLGPHELDPYVKEGTEKMFDVVFLQAQSSEPIDRKKGADETFRKYLAQHVAAVRAKGSVPVVVSTWARQDKPEQAGKLADATIAAANESGAIVLPVGLAFAESLRQRPDLTLHHTDKSHPSAAGSYLYGAMMYSLLYGKSPEGLDYLGECAKPLDPQDAAFLQRLAWQVTTAFYGWK